MSASTHTPACGSASDVVDKVWVNGEQFSRLSRIKSPGVTDEMVAFTVQAIAAMGTKRFLGVTLQVCLKNERRDHLKMAGIIVE